MVFVGEWVPMEGVGSRDVEGVGEIEDVNVGVSGIDWLGVSDRRVGVIV